MFDGLFQPTHLLMIFGIALLVFGPKKLPELGEGTLILLFSIYSCKASIHLAAGLLAPQLGIGQLAQSSLQRFMTKPRLNRSCRYPVGMM
jgi:hypothetical protein